MATTDLKTNSLVTMQVPLYNPAETGDAAYGRYTLQDLLDGPMSAISAENIIRSVAAQYPAIVITLGGAVKPGQAIIDELVLWGVAEENILWAQTSVTPTLSVAGLNSASSLGTVTLALAEGTLTVANMTSASSLATVTLTAPTGGTLTVQGLASASSLGSVTITLAGGDFTVAGLSSASSLGSVTLTEDTGGTEATIYGGATDGSVYYASTTDEAWGTSVGAAQGVVRTAGAGLEIAAAVNDAEEYWENFISRSAVAFELPAGASVTSATLYLNCVTSGGNHKVDVRESTSNAGVSYVATTISATASNDTYSDSASKFLDKGFNSGAAVSVSGFSTPSANSTSATITTVSAGSMVTSQNIIGDNAGGESVTMTGVAIGTDINNFTGNSFGQSATVTGTGSVAITLNSTGLTYLTNRLGKTAKLFLREYDHDVLNSAPTNGAGHGGTYGDQENATQTNRPRLVITYTE